MSKFIFVHLITKILQAYTFNMCVFIYLKFIYVAEIIRFSFCTLMGCLLHTQRCVHLILETTAVCSVEVVYKEKKLISFWNFLNYLGKKPSISFSPFHSSS